MGRFSATALAATAMMSGTALAAIDPIVAKGSHFFMSNSGEQFYIKGIAYQQGVAAGGGGSISGGHPDPLANAANCKRDVKYLKELETNLVRVYAVDPTADHDECMTTFADAGIYVLADLSSPDIAIISDDPQWTDEIYNRYISVIDSLQKYPNTFGFFAGNEVVTNVTNTDAAAFVKAAVRDSKAYIKAKGYREGLGVGYAANDNPYVRDDMAQYFDCGDEDAAIDFWGINIYEWCGDSSFTSSGYSERVAQFKNYNKPVFFSEYGCITPPRLFSDTPVLLGPQMDEVFSGGIVYMYFQEENDYGLVKVEGDSVSKMQPDFDNYSQEIRKAHPSTTKMDSYTPSNTAQSCPAVAKHWDSKSSPLPPSPNTELCACMMKTLSCVVSDSLSPKKYGDLFSYACSKGGKGVCAGIAHDAKTGTYGAYSMCSPEEQLSFAMDAYAKSVGGDNACDFNGAAQSRTPSSSSGQCKSLLNEAGGASGTGTVTSSPTSTGNAAEGAGGSTGSGGGSDDDDGDSGAAILKMGAYVLTAFLTGFGLMLL